MMVLHPATRNSISRGVGRYRGTRDLLWPGLFCLAGLLIIAGCILPANVTGLGPEYPPAGWNFWSGGPAYPDVDSLRRTLRWESFPRREDLEADRAGVLRRLNAVTYDLKIWKAIEGYPITRIQREEKTAGPGELIYSRTGLPTPHHRLETPLEQSTQYFWTVRARFKINGRSRVTEWGEQIIVAGRLFDPQIVSHYRFKTPPE